MKKLILLSLLILYGFTNAQSYTENFIKNTTYTSEYKGEYDDFYFGLNGSNLFINGSGGASGSLKVTNNVLTVNISGSLSATGNRIKLGTIGQLNTSRYLPDVELGPIMTSNGLSQTGYFAKIEDNKLVFYSPYFLNYISSTTLSTSVQGISGINYTVATGEIHTCSVGGGAGGSSGSVTISNGIITFNASGGWDGLCSLKTGNIVYLNTSPIPDTELGKLLTTGGVPTLYNVKIQNNYLVFYPTQTIPPLPSTCSLNFSLDLNGATKMETITYHDDLGRKKQIVKVKNGGQMQDNIQPYTYDSRGRQSKDYLFYAATGTQNGNIYTNPIPELNTFYNTSKYEYTLNPYSEKRLENSSLDRVLELGAPGNLWQVNAGSDADHTIKNEYNTNKAADKVKLYTVVINNNIPSLNDNGYYNVNSLEKKVTKNENWKPGQVNVYDNTVTEFINKKGKTVLKRSFNAGKWHDTYDVYDDYGNLTFVLPPEVNTYPNEQQIWDNQYYNFNSVSSFYSPGYTGTDNEGIVSLNNNLLTVYFENYDDGPGVPLNTSGVAIDLNFNPPLPDMQLGPVSIKLANGTFSTTNYSAYIQNGDIRLQGDGTPAYGVYLDSYIDMSTITSSLGITVTQNMMDLLAYQYRYDGKNRLIEKKLPGKTRDYVVYDNLDRIILTQDGNLAAGNKWLFTKYDKFSRVAYTGIWTNPLGAQSRSVVQNTVDTQTSPVWFESRQTTSQSIGQASTPALVYYTNSSFPISSTSLQVLTIKYYDNYNFDIDGLIAETSYGKTPTLLTTTQETGTKSRVIGTNSWITNINYYDQSGYPIYKATKNNYLNTIDKVKTKADIAGKTLESESQHIKAGTTTLVKDIFTYDHAGRLLTYKQKINSQPEQLIAKNTYDELGVLVNKASGNTEATPLQITNFAYNARGWLKDINDVGHLAADLFAYNINYADGNSAYANLGQPLYDGNMAAISWRTDNTLTTLRSYFYKYDNLSRLVDAQFQENDITNAKFLEKIPKYDRNGNIKQLLRNGQNPVSSGVSVLIDNIAYTYQGNQLLSATDSYAASTYGSKGFTDGNTVGDDYGYDANGNMKFDKNKNITSITYNHLNLPEKVVFNNSDILSPTPKVILFTYDAEGNKLEKKVYKPTLINNVWQTVITNTQYDGNYIYVNNALQYFGNPEGYASNNSGVFQYVFNFKDHLGNIRLSYSDMNNDGAISSPTTEIYYDGFENGSGWESQGAMSGSAVTYDTYRKHSGNASGKIEKLTAGELYVQNNIWLQVNNSVATDYIISGWIYSDNPSVDLFIFMNTATETSYNTLNDYVNTSQKNRWVYIEKRITVPPNISKITLRLDNNGGGTVWFDDVSIRKVNNGTNEIVEENNYYPFGLKHENYNNVVNIGNANSYAQEIKYLGQERLDDLDVNWDNFRHRNYDYSIGRFFGIDPIAEEFIYLSPYQFAHNNPVWKVEIEGLEGVETMGRDVINRNLSFWNRDVIMRTIQINSVKPKYMRNDVALISMGIGIDISKSYHKGNDYGKAEGSVSIAKIAFSMEIKGGKEEVGLQATLGKVEGSAEAMKTGKAEADVTLADAKVVYSARTKETTAEINYLDANAGISGAGQNPYNQDIIVGIETPIGWVKLNLTEYFNALKDVTNFVMSYIHAKVENYLDQNPYDNININPIRFGGGIPE